MTIARLAILLLLPGAMLAGTVAAQQAPVQGNQAQSHSATVALTGEAQWVPTNIEVAEGDRLVLQARGMQINDSVSLDPAGRPDGAGIERPAPDAPYAAVIGRIGGGPPFLVGASYDGAAPASGMLELGINVFTSLNRTATRPLFEVAVEHVPQPPPPDPQPDQTNTLDEPAADGLDEDAGNVVAGDRRNEVEPVGPGGGWLVPLLIGAGGTLALLLLARLLKQALRPKPLPTLTIGVHPSLDREDGGVSGDEIALAGPEVRLRTALEPGATFFDGGEPAVEREERDG